MAAVVEEEEEEEEGDWTRGIIKKDQGAVAVLAAPAKIKLTLLEDYCMYIFFSPFRISVFDLIFVM